jgi:hypothetical protein
MMREFGVKTFDYATVHPFDESNPTILRYDLTLMESSDWPRPSGFLPLQFRQSNDYPISFLQKSKKLRPKQFEGLP